VNVLAVALYVPFAPAVQLVAPTDDVVPAGHAAIVVATVLLLLVHVFPSIDAHDPAGIGVQLDDPEAANDPVGHEVQLDALVEELNVPAAHIVHGALPLAEEYPGWHGVNVHDVTNVPVLSYVGVDPLAHVHVFVPAPPDDVEFAGHA